MSCRRLTHFLPLFLLLILALGACATPEPAADTADNAAEAVDVSKKAIGLVESGKTLAGVQNFDKNATLAWLYQNLAIVEGKDGPISLEK